MKIALSEYDRGVAKMACGSVPWQGGEDGLTTRLGLENAIKLSELSKRGDNFPIDKLSRELAKYELSRPHVELLVTILCGGGGSPNPAVGRLLAELVGRIRKQCPREKAADTTNEPS